MAKKQSLEQKARELDTDETLKLADASRKIASQLEANVNAIRNCINAKRKGFNSYHEMVAKNAGFDSSGDYTGHCAKQRGYKSQVDYVRTRDAITGRRYGSPEKQSKFEVLIELKSPETFDRITKLESPSENFEEITDAISLLPQREKEVIFKRYFRSMTQKQIGNEFGVSYQLIQTIESKAIDLIKERLGVVTEKEPEREVNRYGIEDGELLLAHILRKSKDFQMSGNRKVPRANLKGIVDFINENYHDSKKIVDATRINLICHNPHYKARLNDLKARYLPK
ncbi:MAG: sigma-70 family RNA polymerase sigma factor [Nanoarchaeota archaeon]